MSKYKPVATQSQEEAAHQRELSRERARAFRARNTSTTRAYHDREQRRNTRRHSATWALHPDRFVPIAADGEATDDGVYDLFAMYNPAVGHVTVTNPTGIGLREYVDRALRVKRAVKKATGKQSALIYFAQGYDHEKMIVQSPELTDTDRVALAKQKSRGYGAVVTQGKEQLETDFPALSMQAYIGKKTGRFLPYRTYPSGQQFTYGRLSYQDIHSFFNCSFIKAVEKFSKLWTDEERATYTPLYELIKEGKEARENWAQHAFGPEKRALYNQAELVLTHWLFETVRQLCMEVDIYPTSLAGPAPLARALIKRYGVESHLKPQGYDTVEYQRSVWNMVCRHAFKAGWIELCVQGVLSEWVEYDVSSAYPYQMTKLPCCAHGEAVHLSKEELRESPDKHPFAIYRCTWRCPVGTRFGPFAVRAPNGAIYRPLSGTDWVYSSEVSAFADCGTGSYTVTDGWEWRSSCTEEHPFEHMVRSTFEQRETLNQAGNPAEYILKLSLNSLYGIMAQCAGARRIIDEEGATVGYKTPRYSNLFAAGLITAGTRAQLYRAACAAPEAVVAVATDALLLTRDVGVLDGQCPAAKTLGTFEKKAVKEATLFVAAGIHFAEPTGKSTGKNDKLRGAPSSPAVAQQFWDAWRAGEEKITLTERRFQNILHGAHRAPNGKCSLSPTVGTFQEETRVCDLSPNALASKRDCMQAPEWVQSERGQYRYFPPYATMQRGNPTLYMRPMDEGRQYVPQDVERVDPDG